MGNEALRGQREMETGQGCVQELGVTAPLLLLISVYRYGTSLRAERHILSQLGSW